MRRLEKISQMRETSGKYISDNETAGKDIIIAKGDIWKIYK